jgi:hypothetical protein
MIRFSMAAIGAAWVCVSGVGPAFAASGGMGDPSAHTRELNAICDAQRRGEYPRYHEACLPDYVAPRENYRK